MHFVKICVMLALASLLAIAQPVGWRASAALFDGPGCQILGVKVDGANTLDLLTPWDPALVMRVSETEIHVLIPHGMDDLPQLEWLVDEEIKMKTHQSSLKEKEEHELQ